MTLPDQSTVLLKAIDLELLQPGDVIRWADMTIIGMDFPPVWLVDLATLRSPCLADFIPHLREHSGSPLSARRQVQIIVLAHAAGGFSFLATLGHLFQFMILEEVQQSHDSLGIRLVETLVEWECQDDPDVVEPALQRRFNDIFQEYLRDAQDIASVLPWRF